MPLNMSTSTDIQFESKKEHAQAILDYVTLPKEEREFYMEQFGKSDSINKYCFFNGLAQGSPLSPTLSTLILVPCLMLLADDLGIKGNWYADDGLLIGYDDESEKLAISLLGSIDPSSGIKVHGFGGDKTCLVKSKGIWNKDLKYVGKRYEPDSLHPENEAKSYCGGILANATRTPRDFRFDFSEIYALALDYDNYKANILRKDPEAIVDLEDYSGVKYKGGLCKLTNEEKVYLKNHNKDWIKSKYFGSISAMIYNGTTNLNENEQDFELKYNLNSWCGIQMQKRLHKKYKQWDLYTISSHAISKLGEYIKTHGLEKCETAISFKT